MDNYVREIPLGVLGVGGVGSTLLEMLTTERIRVEIAARAGMAFVPVMLADSRGFFFDREGLAEPLMRGVVEHKRAGGALTEISGARPADSAKEIVQAMTAGVPPAGAILVDTTASEETTPALLHFLDAGGSVVLANKRPLTGPWMDFLRLTEGRRCRYEATVGAGLPVIRTLQSLLDSGDRVRSIQGCFSGTLGSICAALNRGESYSAAVRSAMAAGFTEPDPREDLGGLDVARKALILCRTMGTSLEMHDVQVTAMIPKALEGLDLPGFLERLSEGDAEVEEAVREAAAGGKVLSYVATVGGEVPKVGLYEMDPQSPIGRLQGTENIIIFRTERYHSMPLIIQGPGAGREVTAAGILSDMIDLTRKQGG